MAPLRGDCKLLQGLHKLNDSLSDVISNENTGKVIDDVSFQFVIAPVFGILCQTLSPESLKASEDYSPLTLTLSDYNEPKTFGGYDDTSDDLGKLMTNFKDIVTGDGSEFSGANSNVTEEILTEGEDEIVTYRTHYVVSAEFFTASNTIQDTLKMFYNTIPFHSLPLAVNLCSNTLLGFFLGEGNEIEVTTHPLSKTDTVRRSSQHFPVKYLANLL